MPVKPPKCKTCGEEEWRHVCGKPLQFAKVKSIMISLDGSVEIRGRNSDARMIRESRKPIDLPVSTVPLYPQPAPGVTTEVVKRGRPKTQTPEQRKAYLAERAKVRRARQKAAKSPDTRTPDDS